MNQDALQSLESSFQQSQSKDIRENINVDNNQEFSFQDQGNVCGTDASQTLLIKEEQTDEN